ncbi:MAG: hypothetical protein QME96_11015 [Myxococcota bacterium]|nr:hypothetical protein [Myxococcota bacterium]
MAVRLRQGGREIEAENLAAVRRGVADGRIKPDDEIWDPLEERWRPVAEVTGAAASRAAGQAGAGGTVPGAGTARTGTRRRRAIVVAAVLVAVVAVAIGSFLLYRWWRTPSDEELNRITLDERAAQDRLERDKGESYVKDAYRQRWQEAPDNPMAVYLYVRAADPADEEQLLQSCAIGHPGYAWCNYALSIFYRKRRQWEQARVLAEEAAKAFPATDIEKNLRWLQRANADWYTAWSGSRIASVVCKSGSYLGANEWTVNVWERGRGFACPDVCQDSSLATLCYDITWRRSYGADEDFMMGGVSLALDDGTKLDWRSFTAYHSDGRAMGSSPVSIHGRTGSAILGICLALDRKVVSLVFYYGDKCGADFR